VFPELQKVVGEFYFRLLGEVNRISGKNVDRKHQNHPVGYWFLGAVCAGERAENRRLSFSGNRGSRGVNVDFPVGLGAGKWLFDGAVIKGRGVP